MLNFALTRSLATQLFAAGVLALAGTSANAGLVNSSFETGTLAGWSTNSAVITTAQAHTGSYSVAAMGGDFVRQNFAAVDVSDVVSLSFWVRRLQGGNLDYVQFFYSDASSNNYMVNTLGNGNTDWAFFDLTSQLTSGKQLTGFLVYGTSSGPAYLDDFSLTTTADQQGRLPEPATALLGGLAAMAAAFATRRRRG